MENNIIECTPSLFKKDDHYYLVLMLNDDITPVIDLTDESQDDLDKVFAEIIKFVILNDQAVKFVDLQIDDSISKIDDVGVINIANEYLPILNNEIKSMYDEWSKVKL